MSGVLRTDVTTLPALLQARGAELGDELFVRDAHLSWTYAEFAHRTREIAAGLRARGVGAGDVVGVVLPNGPEYLEVWWAILWLGAVFNPVNPALTIREAIDILEDSGARTVVCLSGRVEAMQEADLPALQDVIGVDRESGGDPLAELRGHGTADDPAPRRGDDLMSLVYTSGTTGRPKGAMLSHANFLSDTRMLAELLPAVRGDTLGMVLPLFHVNAQLVTTVMPMLMGANIAMWERFSASNFWATVAEFEPVTFSAVPTMLAALLHAPGADEAEINTVRYVICGAAPLSPSLFQRFEEKFGIAILEGYGLTEAACCSTLNPFYGPRKLGSIGLPIRGQDVEIRTAENAVAAIGEPGEVCVRGPNVMQGYLGRPEANAESLREGWLHTGDVGYRDADGFVFLVDRKKDMIIRGGENIYPREIEDALLEFDGVQQVAVVGRPHPVRGEEVHAVVVLAAGIDLEAVQQHSAGRLAPYKVPTSWEVLEDLPKTSTGKIDKKPLRERLRASAEA
jgi:acyl-CoA synthetase (AMP-forming)/AMP-acid ligase II